MSSVCMWTPSIPYLWPNSQNDSLRHDKTTKPRTTDMRHETWDRIRSYPIDSMSQKWNVALNMALLEKFHFCLLYQSNAKNRYMV